MQLSNAGGLGPDLIRASLPPGEQLVCACGFWFLEASGTIRVCVALTLQQLVLLRFLVPQPVTSGELTVTATDLQSLRGWRVEKMARGFSGSDIVRLTFPGWPALEARQSDAQTFLQELGRLNAVAEMQQSGRGFAEELRLLSALVGQGVLTGDEFERRKRQIVGSPPETHQSTLSTLLSLFELFQAGALTESEYKMKKWDILSRHD